MKDSIKASILVILLSILFAGLFMLLMEAFDWFLSKSTSVLPKF